MAFPAWRKRGRQSTIASASGGGAHEATEEEGTRAQAEGGTREERTGTWSTITGAERREATKQDGFVSPSGRGAGRERTQSTTARFTQTADGESQARSQGTGGGNIEAAAGEEGPAGGGGEEGNSLGATSCDERRMYLARNDRKGDDPGAHMPVTDVPIYIC